MPAHTALTPLPVPLSFAPPAHCLSVAIISDGNGRWATSRGLSRTAGHRAGAHAARAIIEAAPRLGIHTLTLFALSSANWRRPPAEVVGILALLDEYLQVEAHHCAEAGIRLTVLGRRDRLPARLQQSIAEAERATARGTRLHLRLAVDYSARDSIFRAACRYYKATVLSPDSFSEVLSEVQHGGSTEVDLLIRTGGEQRLSDFLLWECAYAELLFLEKRWPDFSVADLETALAEFWRRERTRGALPRELAG